MYKVRTYQKNKDGNIGRKYTNSWPCRACGELFAKVKWDHIKPVGKEPGWPPKAKEWGEYIERLFCSTENYQPLCKECHQKKTNAERKEGFK